MGSSAPRDYSMQAYQNAYDAALAGQTRNFVLEEGWNSPSDKSQYYNAAAAGFDAAKPLPAFEFPEFDFPSFDTSAYENRIAQLEEQRTQATVDAQADTEAARLAEEEKVRERYMNQARTNVADRLAADKSRTSLLGMDYTPPDVKSTEYKKLVNDEFTKLYGTRSQQLAGTTGTTTQTDSVGRKSLITGANSALEEDEDDLSVASLLGG